MIVYRLSKAEYKDQLSGRGAALVGGRWNSQGVELLYTGSNRALCLAELMVHLSMALVPDDYWMIDIKLPDKAPILLLPLNDLPKNWNAFPNTFLTKQIGDSFIKENKYLGLKVPSAVVQGDYNVLLNPNHALFKRVKIAATQPFPLDHRLFE